MKRRWNEDTRNKAAAESSKKREADDLSEDEEMAEEEEEDVEDEEEIAQIVLEAYESLLPQVKEVLAAGDEEGEKICLVCPTMQKFKDWKALIAHARTIKNKRVHRHRGYFQALEEVIKPTLQLPKREASKIRVKHEDEGDRRIVWPPIVIVKNAASEEQVRDCLRFHTDEQSLEEIVQASGSEMLVIFKQASAVKAHYLAKSFEDVRRSRGSTFRGLIGYKAEPKDMEALDPEKRLVDWSIETDAMRSTLDVLRAKEESEEASIAVLKEKKKLSKLELDKIAKQSDKSFFVMQFDEKHKEAEALKAQTEKWLQSCEAEEKREQADRRWKQKSLEEAHQRNLKRLQWELSFESRKTEQQKILHLQRVGRLRHVFQTGKEQGRETSKQLLALEAEKEAHERKVKQDEDELNARYRAQETEMTETMSKELMELTAKFERERLKALREDAGASGSSEEDLFQECTVCFEPFGSKVLRTIFNPCGHAKTCEKCAKKCEICPICREQIESKVPIANRFFG